ncbi:amidohydrolase family protein [Aureivirga marina]|uniref:amidohydrolase family protein n=1 Tax=Aureivirga marina TaxID=1182451 RepID=UPI0018CB9771|nr:amidohydrolase family protein [Aureivirga marina]
MQKTHVLAIFLLLSVISLNAQTYIKNVSILDVENHKIKKGQTVEIVDGKITKIKSNKKIKITENAEVINGDGKFLMPGLTDAHIHFFQNGGLYSRPDILDLRGDQSYDDEIDLTFSTMEDKLHRYLSYGITNLIDVGATNNLLKKRKEYVNDPKTPSIYMTGPLLTTYKSKVYNDLKDDTPFSLIKKEEDVVKYIEDQMQYNPDFIKIWYILDKKKYDTTEEAARAALPLVKKIIEESHKRNLKVAVHATQRIAAQLAVENGCDFLVHSVKDEVLTKDFAKLLKKNNVILCPTLLVSVNYATSYAQSPELELHELRRGNPHQIGTLMDLKKFLKTKDSAYSKHVINYGKRKVPERKEDLNILLKNLKVLADNDVLIATGTDAGNIGTIHASSYLTEMETMKKSGMSNWQILEASTINGAKVLSKENEFGAVKVGLKANLILLDENPVEDLKNVLKIHRVFNKGEVFDPNKIVVDTPADLAQRQLNGYNLRNIEAFLEPYAEDVEVYDFPSGKLKYKGKDIMRERYQSMFERVPNLYCNLEERIVMRNTVIDKERVTFGDREVEAIAIYKIENGKIKQVYFVRD